MSRTQTIDEPAIQRETYLSVNRSLVNWMRWVDLAVEGLDKPALEMPAEYRDVALAEGVGKLGMMQRALDFGVEPSHAITQRILKEHNPGATLKELGGMMKILTRHPSETVDRLTWSPERDAFLSKAIPESEMGDRQLVKGLYESSRLAMKAGVEIGHARYYAPKISATEKALAAEVDTKRIGELEAGVKSLREHYDERVNLLRSGTSEFLDSLSGLLLSRNEHGGAAASLGFQVQRTANVLPRILVASAGAGRNGTGPERRVLD